MQLDKTAIVIRKRSIVNIIDLSFLVVRNYWMPFLYYALISIVPVYLLDLLLLSRTLDYEYLYIQSNFASDPWAFRLRYYVIITATIFLQAPLVMSLLTEYFGLSVFFERPTTKHILATFRKQWMSILFILGFTRLGLLSLIALGIYFVTPDFRPEIELTIYLGLVTYVYALRAFRPFAPELLVLEKTHLFKSKSLPDYRRYGVRSRFLHSSQASENIGPHLVLSVVATLLTLSFCFGFLFATGVIVGNWTWGIWMDAVVYPAILWMIAAWMSVVRFLFYMNNRINSEGWEIELRFRAEANRLTGASSL